MFIIVYSSFILLNYGFLYSLNLCNEFMYLLFFNLCIYYFKFMYLIYVFILIELCFLLFLKSCIYSIHV